jgi:arabinose-5-phosphate isomerase
MTQDPWIHRAREVIRREAEAVGAVAEQIDESAAAVVDLLFECKGHVLVAGTGTSRAVAQRFAHLLACCGTPALPINAADALHGGAGSITANDVVFIISKGGRSAEINAFAEIAKGNGAKIVALTENPESPLGRMSDAIFKIRATGEVDPFGMIATGSSLVNCAATDVLCVLLLERRGYTKDQFARTHPGGAVGLKIAEDRE